MANAPEIIAEQSEQKAYYKVLSMALECKDLKELIEKLKTMTA